MKYTEKAYINIELGTATWNVDLEHNGMQDILDEGIDCTECEVYELIYEGHMLEENELKELLDNKSESMLYPLYCFDTFRKQIAPKLLLRMKVLAQVKNMFS